MLKATVTVAFWYYGHLLDIIIGIGLAMDCFAVSVSKGICVKKLSIIPTLTMAFCFFSGSDASYKLFRTDH